MQEIIAEVTIKIPEDHILVEKARIQELEARAEPEWVAGLEWFSRQTGIGNHQTLKEKILYPYRDQLEGFVDYPERRGELWRFNTYPVKKWLQKSFKKVNK